MRKYTILKNALLVVALAIAILPAYHLLVITPAFSKLMIRQLEGSVKVFATNLISHLNDQDRERERLTPNSITPEFVKQAGEFRQFFQLRKIKLFNDAGQVIFSTEPGEQGSGHPDQELTRRLRAGQSVSTLVERGRPTLDGITLPTGVIESYIPVFSSDKRYLGAFEIYYEFGREDYRLTWLTSQLGFLFGFLALLMTVVVIHLSLKQKAFLAGRELAAEQLRLARDRWEQTFNAIDDVITIMDQDFRFVQVNQATARLFGTTPAELLGRHCYVVFHNGDSPCPGCPGLAELKSGEAHNSEVYHPRLGKHLLVSISRIQDGHGRLTGFVHVARDITEQKRLEVQLRQTQKLEAIGVLTGGVAHNFRNILASIKTSAQVIEMDYPDDAKLREITSWVIDSVATGSQLVNGLTQFSRVNKNREFQFLDLNKIAADAYQILRGSLSRKVDLILQSSPNRLPVMGEAGALLQVIINICSNANDAIDGTGLIRIRLYSSDNSAVLEITDNGPGIDRRIIDKIFEPFFTTKDVDKGTGLGLSTSFGIVREHGGQIRASSEPGQGATFTITLPLLLGEEFGTAPEEPTTALAAGQRILVVDDQSSLVELYCRLLEKVGYEVAGAGGCGEALRRLRNWHPDLILMDLNMPERDGLSCADAMYELDPRVRIVLISGSEIEPEDNLEGQRSSYIRAFLTKPVGLADLTAIIARILMETK
jgi:PAS domain S-box-containing protein